VSALPQCHAGSDTEEQTAAHIHARMDTHNSILRLCPRRVYGVSTERRPLYRTVGKGQQSHHRAEMSVLRETHAGVCAVGPIRHYAVQGHVALSVPSSQRKRGDVTPTERRNRWKIERMVIPKLRKSETK